MKELPTLFWFSEAIGELEQQVPPPQSHRRSDGLTEVAFLERTIEQAVLMKCARYVSTLGAASLLLDKHFLIEVGALQRLLDETLEEVELLARSKLRGEGVDLANRVLSSFWEDEPSFDQFRQSPKNRDSPPRAKVIAQLGRTGTRAQPNSEDIATAKFIARTHSGFVHGAAPQLSMLIDEKTRKLHVNGIADPSLNGDSREYLANYFFRGIILIAWAAATLGCDGLRDRALEQHALLEPKFHGR